MKLVCLFYRVSLFTLYGNRFICMHQCWNLCHFCWNLSASVVFWCYKAYKIGKYFIYPEGKIFGVHIRYVKIRRVMATEWFTIKQSGKQKHFTKERNTLIMNMSRAAPFDLLPLILISPTGALEKEMATPLPYSCLENFMDRGA